MELSYWQCWMILLAIIFLEMFGSVCLKLSNSYEHPLPSVLMFVCFALAIAIFPYSLVQIDLGTAYAVWSGCAAAGTAMIGIIFFQEKATRLKLLGVGMIILGVILLNLAGNADEVDRVDNHDTKSMVAQATENGDDMDPTEKTTLLTKDGVEEP